METPKSSLSSTLSPIDKKNFCRKNILKQVQKEEELDLTRAPVKKQRCNYSPRKLIPKQLLYEDIFEETKCLEDFGSINWSDEECPEAKNPSQLQQLPASPGTNSIKSLST